MSHFLEAISLSKAYPGESLGALENFSFSLEAGQIQAFIGESGSGKSTLLRLLGGLLKPDEGSIVFKGETLENPEEQLIAGHPEIKMVFQDFDLMPNMTVAENLRYPLLNFNKEFIQERVAYLLSLCRIENLAHKLPRQLSGGQQQRVALARALADEPELLLMDEPFSQLDPVNKAELLQEILQILRIEKVGLVLVTHDVRDALMIGDKVGFLQNGRLLQNDQPQVLYEQPANRTIASFLGHVNFFTVEKCKDIWQGLTSKLISESTRYIGIRAENFLATDQKEVAGLEVEVVRSFYQGNRYLIRGKYRKDEVIIFFHDHKIDKGERVKLVFDESKLLVFCE